MAAGTYVWWEDGTLHYYDMNYTDYVNHITTPANNLDPGVVVDQSFLPPEVVLDGSNHKITITDSVYVEPTANNTEFNVVARLGSQEAPPGDPEAAPAVDVTSAASYIASNPNVLFQVLDDTQPQNLDHDVLGPGGRLDVDYTQGDGSFRGTTINGQGVTSSFTPAQAVESKTGSSCWPSNRSQATKKTILTVTGTTST